jgi:hypothetical protein
VVNRLHSRLKIMEAHAQRLLTDSHFISVLIYPRQMPEAALEERLAEQLRCHCRPDCPGKRIGAVLPEKCSPAELTDRTSPLYAHKEERYA